MLFTFYFSNILKEYIKHNLNTNKSQLADIILSKKFLKISEDLEYTKNIIQQSYQLTKAPFSIFGIFGKMSISEWVQQANRFHLANMNASDFERVPMFRIASEIAQSKRHEDRCEYDLYMCKTRESVDNQLPWVQEALQQV